MNCNSKIGCHMNEFSLNWAGNEMLVYGGMRADYETGHEVISYLGDVLAYTPSRVMYLYSRP